MMGRAVGRLGIVAAVLAFGLFVMAATAGAMTFGAWGQPQNLEATGADADLNTAALEGCPSIARDGLSLYFGSNRSGGYGGVDIWLSTRSAVDQPWGAPTNLGAVINTAADELCPTPMRDGHGLLFVSAKPGGCGGLDIYATRRHVNRGWAEPSNAGCGLNSSADEASPFIVGEELFFSSLRTGDSNIFVAPIDEDGSIGTPAAVSALNTSSTDARPNLRRNGLEIFFDSNRSGGCGGLDLWTATRAFVGAAWSTPTNLGCVVNSPANDLRASLSWDGTKLIFGSNRTGSEGNQDLYVTSRQKTTG